MCEDGALASRPSCGWVLDPDGNPIEHSQGFCCSCDLAQVVGISDDLARAKVDCSLFGSQSSSAHCLRFDPLWYHFYTIGEPESITVVRVTVARRSSSGQAVEEYLWLSTSSPIAANEKLVARLLGGFDPARPPLTLSDRYLALPSDPPTHPRVALGAAAWMFVDKDMVTRDGSQCGKIGVSYEAFRFEQGKCGKRVGSCLGGQLEDLYQRDIARQAAGEPGRYLIHNFANFSMELVQNSAFFLTYTPRVSSTSVVTLTFSADSMRFVINRATAALYAVQVAGFQSFSRMGVLTALVGNTGNVTATFSLSVTGCSSGIAPVIAQTGITIEARSNRSVAIDLASQSVVSTSASCNVRLMDALGAVLDSKTIGFNTTAYRDDRGAQGGNNGGGGGAYQPYSKPLSCDERCAFFNFLCMFAHSCWPSALRLFGTMIGGIVGVLLLKRFLWGYLVSLLCHRGEGSSDDNRSREARRGERDERDSQRRRQKTSKRRLSDSETELHRPRRLSEDSRHAPSNASDATLAPSRPSAPQAAQDPQAAALQSQQDTQRANRPPQLQLQPQAQLLSPRPARPQVAALPRHSRSDVFDML